MDIAFIAPFERIRMKAQSIIDTSNYPARTYLGDLEEGVSAAEKALAEGAKVIISRGGTARLISQQLDVEVIEVEGSMYRTLAFLYEDTQPETKIAVVGFRQLLGLVQPICATLGRNYQSFEVRGGATFTEIIDEVSKWQPDIVIGDAVSFQWAKDRGLNAYLIESSMETIEAAFERAMQVLSYINRHLANEKKLAVVLDCTKEGALLVNKDGEIEEVNRQGCKILSADRTTLQGAPLRHYLPGEELQTAFKQKQLLRNIILGHGKNRLVLDHIPILSGDAKDFSSVVLLQNVERIQEAVNTVSKKLLDTGFYAKYFFEDIKYASPQMGQLIEMARQYSNSETNIMIQGETGTGKELLAQSIHNGGPLSQGPFVAVNCAALSSSLLESELFGYAPGAFTGALRSGKAGLFELAQNGTLFLDELAEMDVFLQSKLLRALQTRQIMRIGDHKVISIKVRIIAATNKEPLAEVLGGRLRADLYYRLNVLDLRVPPLRDRPGDPEFLFLHFLDEHASRSGKTIKKPSSKLMSTIAKYPWPGNVRELENFAEKYVTLEEIGQHEPLRLSLGISGTKVAIGEELTLNELIHAHVTNMYQKENGNITKTAKRLSVDRNTIKRWLNKKPSNSQ